MLYETRPENLKTGIFLDSGDPEETKLVLDELGFLDGQTTNPSLVAKNPEIARRLERGEKLTSDELLREYKKIVKKIFEIIPDKSISIEVYADENTTANQMVEQGKEMYTWIPSAHIKLPATFAGLEAAGRLAEENIRINITLIFKQEQAAAVHAATGGARFPGQIYVSPFIGRLDDIDVRGIDVVANIKQMYMEQNSQIEVLSASIRSLEHLLFLLFMQADIITVPFKVLKQWIRLGANIPARADIPVNERASQIPYFFGDSLQEIAFERIPLNKALNEYNLQHDLTSQGIAKFAEDWNKLIN